MKRMLLYRKKNGVIDVNSLLIKIKNNSNLFMIISMFLCGNLTGTVLLFLSHKNYINIRNIVLLDIEFLKLFEFSFLFFILLCAVILISALCCVGSPFILTICNILGVICGCISTFCLIEFGYKGILFYLISFSPVMFFALILITVYSDVALSLSLQTAKIILFGEIQKIRIKSYLLIALLSVPSCAILSLLILAGKWIFQQLI